MKALESERLVVRPLSVADAEEVIRIRSKPEVSRYQGWQPSAKEEIEVLVAAMGKSEFLAEDQWFQYSILMKEDSRLIGDCGVHARPGDHRQAEVGIALDPLFQNFGYAQESVRGLVGFLFGESDLHRIYASIDPRNRSSVRLFERLGFRKEAHLVRSLWFKGEWADDLIMAVLKDEWGKRYSLG